MTDLVERAAMAIGRAQEKGWTNKWTLARVVLAAVEEDVNKLLPIPVKLSDIDKNLAKTIERNKRYSQGSRRGWVVRKRQKRLRQEWIKQKGMGEGA